MVRRLTPWAVGGNNGGSGRARIRHAVPAAAPVFTSAAVVFTSPGLVFTPRAGLALRRRGRSHVCREVSAALPARALRLGRDAGRLQSQLLSRLVRSASLMGGSSSWKLSMSSFWRSLSSRGMRT